MDTSRLGRGEQIAGLGGVIFGFSAIFLGWFGAGGESATGFEFAGFFRDLVYFLTIVVAVGLAVAKATSNNVNLPVAASTLTAALGILTTILVLIRVIDPPGAFGVDLDREFGLYLALLGAAMVAWGGWTSMQEEGTSFGSEAERIQDRFTDGDRQSGGGAGGGGSS